MLRTGQSPAPSTGRSTSASTPGSHPTPGVLLPGTLASPRTGLQRAGCREFFVGLLRAAPLSGFWGPGLLHDNPGGTTAKAPPKGGSTYSSVGRMWAPIG